jgi:hypothetical protein
LEDSPREQQESGQYFASEIWEVLDSRNEERQNVLSPIELELEEDSKDEPFLAIFISLEAEDGCELSGQLCELCGMLNWKNICRPRTQLRSV